MKVTQCQKIVNYMKTFGSITPLEAVSDLGCMRLAFRINDIKKMGYRVKTELISGKNRLGESTRFAKYSLEGNHNGI